MFYPFISFAFLFLILSRFPQSPTVWKEKQNVTSFTKCNKMKMWYSWFIDKVFTCVVVKVSDFAVSVGGSLEEVTSPYTHLCLTCYKKLSRSSRGHNITMEVIVFFSLLLSVCTLSANLAEADKSSNQQPCPQDTQAVLRQLTASVAVQKEQITVLQKETQGTVSCQVVREVTAKTNWHMIQCCVREISMSLVNIQNDWNDKHSWFCFLVKINILYRNEI